MIASTKPTCRRRLAAVLLLFAGMGAVPVFAQYTYPFQNPELPIEERVSNVVSLLTLEEKVVLLGSRSGVPRLGIRMMGHSEGLHGMAQGGPSNWGRRNPATTTIFPQAIGLGETWDPALLRRVGAAEGYEVRYMVQSEKYHRGGLVVRAPNADLGRDPRWGRTEECYGEDPYFNGTMVVAMVKGLQGDHPKYWLTASLLKHFLANSNEDGRDASSSDFDERLFREYYSVPFRRGFEEGGARCFMAAYNAWNKIPCTIQPVLKAVTMKEWGVDGIVCTDGGALRLLVNGHHYFATTNEAAAACVKAGINQFLDNYRASVEEALTNGLLAEADLDPVIRGTLRVFARLGLLDGGTNGPYAGIGAASEPEPWTTEKHRALARLATQESIVLLKNAKALLPLDKSKLKSIAVVGSRANEVLLDLYSGTPPYTVSPLEGIRNRAGPGVTVTFATNNADGLAVNLARAADVAIVCVGNHPMGGPDQEWGKVSVPSEGREAVDRESLTLGEEDLVRQVYAANPRTIVVLISSFPYASNWTQKHVPAIVHLAHGSQELGNGLADVLFGDYNPAGRLVQTWPRSLDQLPPMMDYNLRHGRTYLYFKGQPLYAFGYGLSYTTFQYERLKTSSDTLARDGAIRVSVEVRNTGRRAGEEVVQLYVRHLDSKVERPLQELRAFRRVPLQPGERRIVDLPLTASSLAYWDEAKGGFVVEPGRIEIRAGGASDALPLKHVVRVQ
jgi:beta-glucosidase